MINVALMHRVSRHFIRQFIVIIIAIGVFGASVSTTAPVQAALDQTAPDQQAARIQFSFDRIGYEWWGHPFFLDIPTRTDCITNDSRRMLMLSLGVRIHNTSRVAMTPDSWNIIFTNNKGRRVGWCFILDPKQPQAGNTAKAILPIPPGTTIAFAVRVFVDPGERVRNGYVLDRVLGRSNTVNVPVSTKTPQ